MGLAVLLTRCDCDFFGTAGALFVSEQDEVTLGTEFDKQLRDSAKSEYPIYVANTPEKIAFQNYVVNLATKILSDIPKSGKPGYTFKFTIIDKNVLNAFAVPGGFVYIYTGIIRKMQDESELAGVLGHEIAHVTRHHYRDAMAKQAGLSVLIQALVGKDAGKITQLVAQSFASLATLAVTRGNESEADQYGTKYIGASQRNPMGIANLFKRMEGQSITILSSHPANETRVADVTKQVNEDPILKALNDTQYNYKAEFVAATKVLGSP